ncbi:hypothetical protein B0H14DRAFT_3133566 [Mycena olivaceomarginata]|nr:hypothetical protein B0H14DRAFT_3133566 [Mycena olivaceomarginata]
MSWKQNFWRRNRRGAETTLTDTWTYYYVGILIGVLRNRGMITSCGSGHESMAVQQKRGGIIAEVFDRLTEGGQEILNGGDDKPVIGPLLVPGSCWANHRETGGRSKELERPLASLALKTQRKRVKGTGVGNVLCCVETLGETRSVTSVSVARVAGFHRMRIHRNRWSAILWIRITTLKAVLRFFLKNPFWETLEKRVSTETYKGVLSSSVLGTKGKLELKQKTGRKRCSADLSVIDAPSE